jgi:voltage-gated potassium channel
MADGRAIADRIRGASTGRLAVALTMAVALLSVVTGVANISDAGVGGPLAAVVPRWLQRTVGFTGALTGFLMVASALGMRRRLRAAWYSTAILLPVTALQGIVQSSVLSVPLVVLSVLAMPTVWLTRRQFDREVSLTTTQLAAGAALLTVQAYATAGAYALRDEFQGIQTLLDAFYFALVTGSTVGYGDVIPQTQQARLFSLSVVVLGTASFAAALGALIAPAIQARLAAALGKMSERQLQLLDDHVIVLGYGDLTEPLLSELEGRADVVVVTTDESTAARLNDRGVSVLTGDPSDEETLERVGIADAAAVIAATQNDGADALAVLTARQLNDDVRIVAAVTDRENVRKLKRAGADTVVSPTVIGGHLLMRSALDASRAGDAAEQLLDDETLDAALEATGDRPD